MEKMSHVDRQGKHKRHRRTPYNTRNTARPKDTPVLDQSSKVQDQSIVNVELEQTKMAAEERKMPEVDCSNLLDDFVASGRTGRRNALPDILDEKNAAVTTQALPFELEKLKCSDAGDKNKSEESPKQEVTPDTKNLEST